MTFVVVCEGSPIVTDGSEQRRQAIIDVVKRIPAGKVSSYGRVAEIAGIPRGARLVGRVLGQLPDGSDVPWHRVLNAAGKIHHPTDSEGGRTQVNRLRDEGVVIIAGKVNMRTFAWQNSLDEALWGPPAAFFDESE